MTNSITLNEAAKNLTEIVDRVYHSGERFSLMREGRVVAHLSPPPETAFRLSDLAALMKTIPHLGPEEAATFEHDLDQARSQVQAAGAPSPWGT